MTDTEDGPVRIDKWLWAARFFKTRALAAAAVAGGKVRVNGERVKPARNLRNGDSLQIHIGPYEHAIEVLAVSTHRGPASQAALLYQESAASIAMRQQLAAQLAADRRSAIRTDGRPSKKERRTILRFKKEGAE